MGKRNQGNTKYSVTRTVYKAVKKVRSPAVRIVLHERV